MVDPTASQFKIVQYIYKQSATVSNLVYQAWLYRYPSLTIIAYNISNKFLGRVFKNNIIQSKYLINTRCATTENSQSNYIQGKITISYETLYVCLIYKIITYKMRTLGQVFVTPLLSQYSVHTTLHYKPFSTSQCLYVTLF